jgi:hypothetical protein
MLRANPEQLVGRGEPVAIVSPVCQEWCATVCIFLYNFLFSYAFSPLVD